MKKFWLIALFLLGSTLRADIKWPQLDVSDSAISYSSGFFMASLYDLAFDTATTNEQKASGDNFFGPQPYYWQQTADDYGGHTNGYWKVPSPFGQYWKYWVWKMGLSMAAGAVWDLHVADRDNAAVGFSNIGMGALGGLTSVVIHF